MWSPWSHCGIIDGDKVIEAVAVHGVVETPLAEVLSRSSRWAIVEYPGNADAAIAAVRSQLGKPYDYSGVAGVGLHRDWNDLVAWFCSELTTHGLLAGGLALFRIATRRVTPQHLWMLNYPIIEAN